MIIERHLNDAIPMLSRELNIPPALESTVRLALAKRPEARFPDARSMLARLLENRSTPGVSDAYAMPTLKELNALDHRTVEEVAARIAERRSQPDYRPPSGISPENVPAVESGTVNIDAAVDGSEAVSPREAHANGLPLHPVPPVGAEFTPSIWMGVTFHGLLFLVVGLMLSVFSSYS